MNQNNNSPPENHHLHSQPIPHPDQPNQIAFPAYSFTVNPLPYNSSMLMQENYAQATMDFDSHHYNISQPANLVPPPQTREYEEDENVLYQRESSIESSGGGDWFQESDDPLSNVLMRITIDSQEDIALVDMNQGQEPVVFDMYEELNSFLEELVGPGENWLQETILQQLKTRKYQTTLAAKQVGDEEAEICVVCLSGYENQETLVTLDCGHEYHADCIKRWLTRQNVCPICKRTALRQEC